MKEYRTKDGPYAWRLSYECSEIDQICEEALRRARLMPVSPQPVKIDLFLERYFEVRVVYEDLGPEIMGCTIFNRQGRVTGFILSSQIEADGEKGSERRARSTLAHEGGHGLLHPKLFMEDVGTGSLFPSKPTEAPRFLCRTQDIGAAKGKAPYDGRWWEWQANRAIGGLLLPKKLVMTALSPVLDQKGISTALPDDRRAEAVKLAADTFEVNPAVARIRLDEMFARTTQIQF